MAERDYEPFPNQEWRNGLQARMEIPLAMRLLRVPRGGRVLELGCGRGVALPRLADLLAPAALFGIDNDGTLIAEAATRCAHQATAVTLVQGDVRNLPFADGSFDVVIDFGTCYHVRGSAAAVAEVERVLAPGGQFIYESPISQALAHPGRSTRKRLPWSAAGALEPLARAGLWSSRVRVDAAAPAPPRARGGWWQWPLLMISIAFFLWMFVASDAFARTMETSVAANQAPPQAAGRAMRFAHDWRHGQAGWPLFVPGFFLTAIAVNVALRRRSFGRFALMLGSASLVGAAAAYHFSDVGSGYLISLWEARSGADLDVVTAGARWASPLLAGATLLAWVLLIAAGREAAANRTWWPLLAPGIAYVLVAGLRNGGFAFGELSGVWFARLAAGDGTALVSSLLAVALTALFVRQAWREGGERRARLARWARQTSTPDGVNAPV